MQTLMRASAYAVLVMLAVAGCDLLNSLTPTSVQPLLIVNPPIIDFSKVGTSASMKVSIYNTSKENVIVESITTNAEGITLGGETTFVLEPFAAKVFVVYFDWLKYKNAAEVALTIKTSLLGYETITSQILLPTTRTETKLTGPADVFSTTYNRPVKFSGNGNLILYNAGTGGTNIAQHIEVFTMNLLGEDKRQITQTPSGESSYGVDLSAGGTRILFYTEKADGSRNMYIWEETGIDTLTKDSFINTPVAFSPDGTRVLYNSNAKGNMDVYYMTISDKKSVELTRTTNHEEGVSWTIDQTAVLIKSVIGGQSEVLVSFLRGDATRVTNNAYNDIPVGFSPSTAGNRILFYSDRDFKREIYTMAINGGDIVRLTNNQTLDFPSFYSPDGANIYYYNIDFNNNADIYSMDARGGLQSVRRLTALYYSDYPVAISPDGRYLLFYSERRPGYVGSDVFIIRTDSQPTL